MKPEQLRALLLLLHYSAATAFYLQTLILTASDSTAKLFPVKTQRGLPYPVSPCLFTVREGSLSPPRRAAVNGGLRAELQAPRGSQRGDRQLLVLQAPRTVFSKATRGSHLVSPLRHLYTDGTRGAGDNSELHMLKATLRSYSSSSEISWCIRVVLFYF